MPVDSLPRGTAVSALLITLIMTGVALAGCFGGAAEDTFEYTPGEDWKPTGREIRLRATVMDLVDHEVFPGLNVNFWAFCFKPMDPEDEVSAAAIEYFPDQTTDVAPEYSEWQGTCSVPGPTIRVQQGDKVIVQFDNLHVHHHTIHWHGQHVPFEMDGVPGTTQNSVAGGSGYKYEFIAKREGTLWYHCHVDTQMHVMQGLYGVFIVEPQETRWEPKDIDREQVLVYSTLNRAMMENTPARQEDPHADHAHIGGCGETGQPGCQNPGIDVTPDVFLLNGKSFPNTLFENGGLITLEPGERVRLRILNAGTTFESLHPHGHDLLVTHTDGNPIPPSARVWKDTVPIAPGERLDVVLEGRAGNEGIWVFHTHVVNHVTNSFQYPGGMLTKIVYPDYMDDLAPFRGELPGGQPYQAPVQFPKDFASGTKIAIGTDNTVDEEWRFPVEAACGIRTLRLTVGVDSAGAAAQSANDVTATLTNPNGQELAVLELGNKRFMEWVLHVDEQNQTADGSHLLTLSGRSVDAVAELQVEVDYFDTLAEHNENGGICTAGDGHGHPH